MAKQLPNDFDPYEVRDGMNHEALAKAGLATGVSLFGLTLADISTIVTILAGLAAAFASIAAGVYYIRKGREL